jgi:hypothetical protein
MEVVWDSIYYYFIYMLSSDHEIEEESQTVSYFQYELHRSSFIT